jgi:hypothetical protein
MNSEVQITERNLTGKCPSWKASRPGGTVAIVYKTEPTLEQAEGDLKKAEDECATHEWLYGGKRAAVTRQRPAAAYPAPAALPGDHERQEARLAAGVELASFFKTMAPTMSAQERYARVASAEFEALCARAGISPEPFKAQFKAVCLSPAERRLFEGMGFDAGQIESIALGRA